MEVVETEARTRAAVALLVDTSFSMAMDGRWVPMKRTTGAAPTRLVAVPGDHLEMVGFGRHAEVMQIEQLTALDAMWEKGTNLHHALLLANRHFRRHPHEQPVLLVVTDGEPRTSSPAARSSSTTRRTRAPSRSPSASWMPRPGSVPRRPSSGSARMPAWRASSTPWPAGRVARSSPRATGDLGAAVVGSYLGSRSPSSPFGSTYRDLFGGRGFWAE